MVTIRVLAASSGWVADEDVPMWLQSGDVEAFDGRGDATLTTDESQAMKFEDNTEAIEFWRRQSTVRPLRADGKPNRPLTTFTVEIA